MQVDLDKAKDDFFQFKAVVQPLIDQYYTEAKTRIAFIDPVLTRMLGWDPLTQINYEERYTKDNDPLYPKDDEKKCVDYVLSLNEPILVIEAKRNLKTFALPKVAKTRFKLSGVLKECPHLWSAIRQAREYCDEVGARYCLVTNGHQYVAFKALREVGKWTDGYAVVWRSLDELYDRFGEFYMCLSRETIQQDRLTELANEQIEPIERYRPRTYMPVVAGSFRNDLHDILHAMFGPLLLDRSELSPEFLEKCYVSSEVALRYGKQLASIIVDRTPDFAAPIHPVRAGSKKDKFHGTINHLARERPSNPLVVVMGGPGVGKTTFLQWYFRSFTQKLDEKNIPARDNVVLLTVDFRQIDCLPAEVRDRTYKELGEQLKIATKDTASTFAQLSEVYRTEINDAKKAELVPFAKDLDELAKQIGLLLKAWRADTATHLRAVTKYLRARCGGKQIVILLDNMDQKVPDLQTALYQTAQELVFSSGAVVILSLREATYRNVQGSPQFNAFSPVQFHVMVQPARIVLDARLAYLNHILGDDDKVVTNVSDIPLTVRDLRALVGTINNTLNKEPAIVDGIEALSNGNTREQLRIIHSYLVSGQTKITEYLSGTKDWIPAHEFFDSIIHEDRRIFTEQRGQRFMNVFGLGPTRTASHFTTLRILSWLKSLGQEGDLSPTDFLSVPAIFEQFESQGFSMLEIESDVQRMAAFGLLMPESQDPTAFNIGETFALSKCGVFYLERLYMEFSYAYAMVADTAWTQRADAQLCAGLLKPYLNLPKMPLAARLYSTKMFLTYLEECENRELTLGAVARHSVFGSLRFVPAMWEDYKRVEARHAKNLGNSVM